MHKRLIAMTEILATCIEGQLNNIEEADACELGEAIDMLKDLEETLYYHTITEAMKHDGTYGFRGNFHPVPGKAPIPEDIYSRDVSLTPIR